MPFELKTLNKNVLSRHLNDLLGLDISISKEMGAMYGNDPWDGSHFCKDLKRKWEFSHLVFCDTEEMLCGFMVASEPLLRQIHIHRLAVGSNFRQRGIGTLLMKRLFNLVKQYHYRYITVEVCCLNTKAISFYERYGFVRLSGDELSRYAAERKQNIQVIGDFIREPDGYEFYVLQKAFDMLI